jgi:hypothetical protein
MYIQKIFPDRYKNILESQEQWLLQKWGNRVGGGCGEGKRQFFTL